MPKPKKIQLLDDANRRGINITYVKSANSLKLVTGDENSFITKNKFIGEMHLAKFFSRLGITEKDCKQSSSLLNAL